ncbi:hypothetical protein [Microbacterium sp.]|uniref:hypothetical protein n=1 Tax=Microbacterium sp. TaxID=51671 RepID=UPI003F9B37E5
MKKGSRATLVWGIVAVILTVTAALRPPVAAVFLLALLACGVIAGVVAVLLGIRALRGPDGKASPAAGIALGGIGIVTGAVSLALLVPALFPGASVQVELRASSEEAFTVSYSYGEYPRDDVWQGGDWSAKFGTSESSTEMVVTAEEPVEVSCEILRDGEVVAAESSGSGTVTCRFDAAG